jgi:hypothetical protein
MLKIETRLDPIRIQGDLVKGLPNEADQLIVSAEWHSNKHVTLDWHGRTITVSSDELRRAIANAENHD